MIHPLLNRFCLASIVALVVLPPVARDAHAQAWLPEKGEATVSIAFQNIFVTDHLVPTSRVDLGQITSNTLTIDASYAATRRLAVDFALPFVASKYNGPYPHEPSAVGDMRPSIDTGQYHGTLQDLRFAVRYNVLAGRVAVTPFIGTVVPSHDYTFYAHSAVGRRLREVAIGTYVASLMEVVPAFVQARYSYSFVERVLDIPHNKSNADVEVGYFVNPSFRVFASASGEFTHGGLDLTLDAVMNPAGEMLSRVDLATGAVMFGREFELHHDRIDRGHYVNVGGGAAVSLSDSVDLFGSFVKSVAARNGHAVNRGITIGLSWTVRPKGATPLTERSGGRAARAERSLVRCSCQKGKL